MPARMVDGDALWRSDKLAQVQPPSYRGEYANLIPLALADGTFECNPRRVWADVYSYNRSDITVETVEKILNEFEKVGLLRRTKDELGKIWGFWNGIESRLPSESTRERYKQGKSNIFNDIDNIMTSSRPNHDDIVAGLDRIGLDKDRIGMECEFKNLSRRFRNAFGFKMGKRADKEEQEYKKACATYGEDWVLEQFKIWAADNQWIREKKAKFPLTAFYEELEEIKESNALKAAEPVAEILDTAAINESANAEVRAKVSERLAEIEQDKADIASMPMDKF
jgi:hypothetical protein